MARPILRRALHHGRTGVFFKLTEIQSDLCEVQEQSKGNVHTRKFPLDGKCHLYDHIYHYSDS